MTLDDVADMVAKDSSMLQDKYCKMNRVLVTSNNKQEIIEALEYFKNNVKDKRVQKKVEDFYDKYTYNKD